LFTFIADLDTIGTALTTGTGLHTVSTVVAVVAPAVVPRTVTALAAVGAERACTVFALLGTVFADIGAFRAAIAAVTDVLSTVNAGLAVMAEIAVATDTVDTSVASAADVLVSTIGTFFSTVFTDGGTTVTAVAAVTDQTAISAGAALVAPAVIPYTRKAISALLAQIVFAVTAVFLTALADIGAVSTAVAAVTDSFYTISAVVAVVTPTVITHAVFAQAAIRAEHTGAVFTLLGTTLTDIGAFRAAVAAVTDSFYTISAVVAVVTPTVVTHTVLTVAAVSAEHTGAIFALLGTTLADGGTVVTTVSTYTNDCTGAAGHAAITPFFIS